MYFLVMNEENILKWTEINYKYCQRTDVLKFAIITITDSSDDRPVSICYVTNTITEGVSLLACHVR